ncbi:MAG: cytochrome c, partial [Gemmatimonadota bacterium]|nr:cytochrome c [Gemmatimonadota bacterium]
PKVAARGRKLFAETCGVCHGPDAAGTQLGPSLVDAEWLEGSGTLPEIERVIREGVLQPRQHPVPMPPLGGGDYTEEEVRSLAAYVYSLGKQ